MTAVTTPTGIAEHTVDTPNFSAVRSVNTDLWCTSWQWLLSRVFGCADVDFTVSNQSNPAPPELASDWFVVLVAQIIGPRCFSIS